MKESTRIACIAAAALCTSLPLHAQAQSAYGSNDDQSGSSRAESRSQGNSGSSGQSDMIRVTAASELIGLDVRSSDRRHAGEIEYVVVSPTEGVSHALVGAEGELEIEDGDLLIVPFSALEAEAANDERIPATASLEMIQGGISIDENDISELTEPMVMTRVYDYFVDVSGESDGDRSASQTRYGSATKPGNKANDAAGKAARDGDAPQSQIVVMRNMVATLLPGLQTFDQLRGMTVKGPAGETFGEIDELIVNATTGEVLYALVAHGGFLGIGEDWYAVPLEAFSWDAQDGSLMSNVPIEDAWEDRRLEQGDLPTRVPESDLEALYRAFDLSTDRLRISRR